MRRWCFLLLMLVLPTQFVWAAAAPYCGHEVDGISDKGHFGHHEHRHQADEQNRSDDNGTSDPSKSSSAPHVDCESCHFGSALTLASFAVAVGKSSSAVSPQASVDRFTSQIPVAPERPDIRKLDAAARPAGGVGLDHRIQIPA